MDSKTNDWIIKADDRGHFDIRIKMDGTWLHEGAPIKRDKLVKLFASVLHLDEDGQYWLVTPVEKGRIDVDVAPLLISQIQVSNAGEVSRQSIEVKTTTGDACKINATHPLRLVETANGEQLPIVTIRDNLCGLFNRASYYDLMDLVVEGEAPSGALGVWSEGIFFELESDPK